ncbi:MAG TPA: hypothetical protein VM054_06770 [bacterium]|nr:hypothetical protein [bacterium]
MLPEERRDRAHRLAGLLVVLLLVLFGLVRVVFFPSDTLLRYTNDDTFYYLGMARNLVAGNGLSFDGMHQTNGFHPLWLGICSLPYLLGAGTFAGWRIVMALTVLVWGAGLLLARSVLRRRFGERGTLPPLILLAWPLVFSTCACGMEVTLTFTLVFTALEVADRYGVFKLEGSRRAELGIGALLALIFLSRLDSFFLHVAAFCYLLAAYRRAGPGHGKGWRDLAGRFLRLFGPSVLALVGFLAWNQLTFGHLVPISGALKGSFPVPSLMLYQVVNYREMGLLALSALVWVAVKRRELDAGVGIVAWGFFGQLAYMLLFQKWAFFAYYMVALGLPVSILAVGHLSGRTLRGRIKLRRALIVAVTVVVLAGQVVSLVRAKFGFQSYSYQAALWAAGNTDEDAVFAMTDCGVFGYFSERSCINLDGLVNDYRYQRELSAGRLTEYLEAEGVDYIVFHDLRFSPEGDYEAYVLNIPGRLYGGMSAYTLQPEDIVFRSEPYRWNYDTDLLTVGIWKTDW